jgi:hypothetical protein
MEKLTECTNRMQEMRHSLFDWFPSATLPKDVPIVKTSIPFDRAIDTQE